MDSNKLLSLRHCNFIKVSVRQTEVDRPIKHLIQPGPGVSLFPAKQHNSYTIYGLSSVQVAEELLGHTCRLIQPLDYAPHCL